jgi:rhodanese-related sulfurtransferase
LTDHNSPLVLIMDENQDPEEAARQLARIGYDDIRGVARSPAEGLASFRTVGPDEYAEAARTGGQILDVRAPNEWETGFVEGAILSYLPHLAQTTPLGLDPSLPVWVACGSGYRASIAAGILQDRGFEPVVLATGGATDVVERKSKDR